MDEEPIDDGNALVGASGASCDDRFVRDPVVASDNYVPSVSDSRIGPGLILGFVAMMTMTMAVEVLPGVRIDLRYALIATSGLLFGPISGMAAGILSGAMRIYFGGDGTLAGLAGIALSMAIGGAAHLMLKGRMPTILQCIFFAFVVGLGSVASLLLVPAGVRGDLFQQLWRPLLSLTFTSTLFTSYFFAMECARRKEYQTLTLYRKMVDALPDCLNVKDLDGRFLIANKATADLMKARHASDLIGKTDFDFYPQAVAAGYREVENAVLKSSEAQRLEQMVDFKDGKIRWLETVKVPITDDAGALTGLISYNRDITDFHFLNEQKTQFISTMSHEIRTPLTSICGSLRLVASAFTENLPPKAARLIAMADRNAQHLSELINNLLDYEKLDAGQTDFAPENVDILPFAQDAVESMKHYLPQKNLSWTVSPPEIDATVLANPVRLRQIMLNLLSNAGKFAPAESVVEVEISMADNIIRLCVLDMGPGVTPDFEPTLFARFRQEKATAQLNPANGTGLGLSLTKSFVEHMSGNISYRRRNDRTEFRIEFPSVTDNQQPETDAVSQQHSTSKTFFDDEIDKARRVLVR